MKKLLWPILGCKVGQGDPIVMKLDVWHCLLDVYTKFHIVIWKHVEKKVQKKMFAGWEFC